MLYTCFGREEVKNRIYIIKTWKRKTGIKNIEKYIRLKNRYEKENIKTIVIIFAMEGFTKEAEKALNQNSIFYGDKIKYPVFQS